MKELTKNTNYKDFSSLLNQEFLEKEKFKGILDAVANISNDLEDAIFEVRDEYYLDSATGIQLDIIGIILGLDRNGRNDASYRNLLRVKSEINFNAGTPETLIQVAVSLYEATEVEYVPIYPAKVQLWTNGNIGVTLDYNFELDTPGDLMLLDDGSTMIVQLPDEVSEELLYEVVPVGVDLLLANDLILDDGFFMLLSGGNPEDHLIVT